MGQGEDLLRRRPRLLPLDGERHSLALPQVEVAERPEHAAFVDCFSNHCHPISITAGGAVRRSGTPAGWAESAILR